VTGLRLLPGHRPQARVGLLAPGGADRAGGQVSPDLPVGQARAARRCDEEQHEEDRGPTAAAVEASKQHRTFHPQRRNVLELPRA
jgi:hypothetical protein